MEVEDIKERDITDMPKPIPATTTHHYLVNCSCSECNLCGIETGTGPTGDAAVSAPNIPQRGSYGRNAMMAMVHLPRPPPRQAERDRHG